MTNPLPIKIVKRLAGLALIAIALAACDPVGEIRQIDLGDIKAPQLGSKLIQDNGEITLEFDEPVRIKAGSLFLNERDGEIDIQKKGDPLILANQITLSIAGSTVPGKRYSLQLAVEDANQNSLSLVLPFYGPNPHPARLLVNELLTAVSTKNRDALELLAVQSGNIGGMTIFWGTPDNFDYAFSLPDLEVKVGDFVTVHCKPEGLPEEIDELRDIAESGGKNASPLARDFWVRDAPGLPDDTGIISIAANPLGKIDDAVFYSDKTTVAGKDYRSFGSKKLLDRAETLQACQAWKCAVNPICVEDAAPSAAMTATRTLNRGTNPLDTNANSDWHVVPSGLSSLGTPNSDEVYVKP